METNVKLNDEQINLLKEWLKQGSNGKIEFYWDYRDELSKDQINKIIEGKINDVEDEIYESNLDYIHDRERELIKEALKECGIEEDVDIHELREELLDYISVDTNIRGLIRRTDGVPVRITWYSNYDCINSHWYESQGGYSYVESYFGAMVDRLNLNPKKVKQLLIEKGIKVVGKWPNKANREGKELVDYDDFYTELENHSCGAGLLVIVGTIDLDDFIKGTPQVISIPKGNGIGIFSSSQGGGSPIDAELKHDLKIDLTKGTKYDHWGLVVDSNDGYSIDEVYGVTSSFWGDEIKVLETKNN
jgi:hypothetical protein